MEDEGHERLATAAAILREAGAVALRAFRERPHDAVLTFKGQQDDVSGTDAQVEGLIRNRLAAAFPEEHFFGEEGGGDLGGAVWVCDPIDGTSNFVRNVPAFCLSLAFVRSGRIEIGVIHDPVHDETFAAARGGGALLNGDSIAVRGEGDLTRATVEVGWSARRPLEDYLALDRQLAKIGARVRRGGSGALGLAYVAAGRFDAYCELHMNAWDALAGLLLVEEAGGWTNDFLANDGLANGNFTLACSLALREKLSAICS